MKIRQVKKTMHMAITGKVRETIKSRGMLKKGETVCVAVSGGVDSCVLLHVLSSLKDEFAATLVVCHLNHNLRGKESDRDARFVERLAGKMALLFEGKKLTENEVEARGGDSLQAWARGRRLEFLEEAAGKRGARRIALGHNSDDQAETVLLRLIKGAALKGLTGMKPVRPPFIRPLIDCSREEILKYASVNKIKHVEDATNKTTKYLRNSVRLELIPYLEANYNPNIKSTLLRTQNALATDEDFLDKVAANSALSLLSKSKGKVAMDRRELAGLHTAIAIRIFQRAVSYLGVESGIYTPQIELFLSVLNGRRPNLSVMLFPGLWLLREYDVMTLLSKAPALKGSIKGSKADIVLTLPGLTQLPGGGALKATVLVSRPRSLKPGKSGGERIFLDFEKLGGLLSVRTFQPGDWIRPFGMKGRKKLKDIFIDEKIPPGQRRTLPLVVTESEVVWAVGVKRSERFKVGKSTKKILKLEMVD